MRFNIILIILFSAMLSQAQTFEIRTQYDSESNFDVQMRCTSQSWEMTNFVADLVFGIKWLNSYDVDLSLPTGNYEIIKSGNEEVIGIYEWQAYGINTFFAFPETWPQNEWKTIASFTVSQSFNEEIGAFEIIETGFHGTTNLNFNIDGADYIPAINGFADNVVIPLNLVNFKAEKYNNTSTLLSWNSENEINFDRFDLERSIDNKNWEFVTSISGTGLKSNDYTYIDKDVYNDIGNQTIYYRLKIIDLDGKYDYSDIKFVDFNSKDKIAKLEVYPNPSNNKVFFHLDGLKSGSTISVNIYDNVGKLVFNKNMEYQTLNNLLMDKSEVNIKSGVYNVIITDINNKNYYEKLVLTK